MTDTFQVDRGPTRVVFGAGAARAKLGAVLDARGLAQVLVICTPGRKSAGNALASELGARAVGVLASALEHVPAQTVADALREVERTRAATVLALGGGSAIGLAKAIALSAPVRIAAVPTTYSGSEMTPVYGITEGGKKRTGRDDRVRAALVVYDPTLTLALPRDVTVSSIWNAMAHAVEALWSPSPDAATRLVSEEALRLLGSALTRLLARLDDPDARRDALEGAYLAGSAFADAGPGVHHKLCHVLGGSYGLSHAHTHAALLPQVAWLERDAAPEAMRAIARALGVLDAVSGLEQLARVSGATRSLGALGLPHDALDAVTDAMLASPGYSPRALDRATLRALLDRAYAEPTLRATHSAVRAPAPLATQPGYGGTHLSEALPVALPERQNTPRPAPYGLYPECVNATPFTVRNAENARVWMYRIRASFSHTRYVPIPAARFAAELGASDPNRARWKPLPIPEAPARVDFLDGLVTLGGAGDAAGGPGYGVPLYAANADMTDRAFASVDGDLLLVPQTGALECRTELGWLRAAPGSILVIPRGIKFAIGVPEAGARGWMLEVQGTRLRLPERGPIGSNGLADARHFLAPVAAYEDRACPGFQLVQKLGGGLWMAEQDHSPFDVVAWHGNHVPYTYDLSLFNAMGSVTWDHADPSIHTVLTAPLDDRGRAVADFVVFRGRWDVAEHSFRPPYMHRNAATEINGVVKTPSPEHGYVDGCTFVTPLLTAHGVSTSTYDTLLEMPDEKHEGPRRLPDDSLWIMLESALPFRSTRWARETPLVDGAFHALFEGMRARFDPSRR